MAPKGCLIQCLGREQEELTFTKLVTLPLLVLLAYLGNPHTNMARQALPSTFTDVATLTNTTALYYLHFPVVLGHTSRMDSSLC